MQSRTSGRRLERTLTFDQVKIALRRLFCLLEKGTLQAWPVSIDDASSRLVLILGLSIPPSLMPSDHRCLPYATGRTTSALSSGPQPCSCSAAVGLCRRRVVALLFICVRGGWMLVTDHYSSLIMVRSRQLLFLSASSFILL